MAIKIPFLPVVSSGLTDPRNKVLCQKAVQNDLVLLSLLELLPARGQKQKGCKAHQWSQIAHYDQVLSGDTHKMTLGRWISAAIQANVSALKYSSK